MMSDEAQCYHVEVGDAIGQSFAREDKMCDNHDNKERLCRCEAGTFVRCPV